MHTDIRFPNMGIVLENVRKSFSIGNFTIAMYGILIGLGVVIGLFIAMQLAKKTEQKTDTYYDVAIVAMIVGVIGARLYYVAFSWDYYKNNLGQIFHIRGGGLAIYGGLIAGTLGVYVYSRIKKNSFLLLMDTIVPGVAFAQAMGRWGNFCNREAFGEYTNNFLAMQLPTDAVFQSSITETMRANLVSINGVDYIQVHPTFLYESVWNVLVCVFLIIMTLKFKKYNGQILLLYFLAYGLGRVWIEGLRTDQLVIGNTCIPVSQLLAGILIVVTSIFLIVIGIKNKRQHEA